ncbi:hypothetical protein F442_13029 [Phytophthora nicotianae P10297]|uniref:Uncharacterized protein n=2 Tax=Phytophthora nicotianae TaxID=4792 RepID=W2YWT9_PHYNI|nr:hypothetical protein L914_12665 [Phytophthora nicotianae]ETP39493.1 hypothetical protein F442_13029 [Phytophthora nicotianae P10297]
MSSSAATQQVMPSIADILFDATVTPEDAEAKLTTFGAKQLRTECYLRQLRIVKKGSDCNDHKVGYVALLMQQKRVFTEMQRLGVEDGPSKIPVAAGIKRRTRHCMIRLLNVMFSETFAGRVHEIDGKPTRAELDSNQTHASSSFWTGFHDAYLSDQAEFGKLNSTLPLFAKCNPAIIVPHDAAKLRDMWKDSTSTRCRDTLGFLGRRHVSAKRSSARRVFFCCRRRRATEMTSCAIMSALYEFSISVVESVEKKVDLL